MAKPLTVRDRIVELRRVPARTLIPNPANWRKHPKAQQEALEGVLREVGYVDALLARETDAGLMLIDGHLRAGVTPDQDVPVLILDVDEHESNTILATFDPLAAMAEADRTALDELLREVDTGEAAVQAMLAALAEQEGVVLPDFEPVDDASTAEPAAPRLSLAERFGVPPFSVLDARQGYWQDRKRAWLALGIQSELGRGEGVTWGDTPQVTEPGLNYYRNKNRTTPGGAGAGSVDAARSEWAGDRGGSRTYDSDGYSSSTGNDGKAFRIHRREADARSNLTGASPLPTGATETGTQNMATGTSIFDPVLCELAYRWFCPPDGAILDPFAGGSVRGIVAARLGRRYTGIDLSAPQIAANEAQARRITPDNPPHWLNGDSAQMAALLPADARFDFVFSCPPYADLEVYSDHPSDLSTMDYPAFMAAYRTIIAGACARLKPDRFACFVVGDVRDPKGNYRNFVSDTISAFQDAGLRLYNEAILVTSVGSLPIRVGRQFESGRKLGKTHQNVLVFLKGDAKRATGCCGPVEFGEVDGDVTAPE